MSILDIRVKKSFRCKKDEDRNKPRVARQRKDSSKDTDNVFVLDRDTVIRVLHVKEKSQNAQMNYAREANNLPMTSYIVNSTFHGTGNMPSITFI